MNSKQLLALYGLKWNPFSAELPEEALVTTSKIEHFAWRAENLVMDGGFALITGDSGMGKSVALRLLYERLGALRDIKVGEFTRPQSGLIDFYRELGMLFGVELRVNNRWGGYQALREKWKSHIQSTLLRPVLLIDEAQEMQSAVLSELRLLSSVCFDSQIILTTVFSGDKRLTEKFRTNELIPLGTRIRTRLNLQRWSNEELTSLLKESIKRAGAPRLMTEQLIQTLAEHAAGSPRVMFNMAYELLMVGAKQELRELDEKLYLQTFLPENSSRPQRREKAA